MRYKLICTDIDGTLLNDEKKLLPKVKQSLKHVKKMGIEIVLASGRMPAGVEIVEKELGIKCIKMCNAGSYILMEEQCISTEYLPNSVMQDISKMLADKSEIPLWIFREREWFVTGIDEYVRKEIGFVSYHPKVVNVNDLAEQWEREGNRANKLVIAAKPETIKEIYKEMKHKVWQDIDLACSADTLLEIFPKGANKGKALYTICQKLKICPKEVIALGDHELDIPLIEAAGTGIAMGNAITALKEKADFITKSNNEAGVAYALEHYLLNERKENEVW